MDEAAGSGAALVRLELDKLDFVDSTGLKSLIRAAAVLAEADVRFEITRGPALVHRVFELTCVVDQLPFID